MIQKMGRPYWPRFPAWIALLGLLAAATAPRELTKPTASGHTPSLEPSRLPG